MARCWTSHARRSGGPAEATRIERECEQRVRAAGAGGFTFAEVAASLLMLSVLVASTAPIFSTILGVYHLRGAAQEVFAELQNTRLSAVMENNRYRFYVVPGSPIYKIHDDRNHNNAEDEGEVTIRTLELDDPGVTLASTDSVTFLPNGTALTYGTITVTGPGGRTKTVAVSSGGRIRIQ